eukprot:34875-Pleurochrysis_carterae.AAC.1
MFAFRRTQAALQALPVVRALHAANSRSDAARPKADVGAEGDRTLAMVSRDRSGRTRTSTRLTCREERSAEASSRRNEQPARNVWCLWAR